MINVANNKPNKLMEWLLTLLVFLNLQPCFVWSQVFPLLYRAYTGVMLFSTVVLFFSVMQKSIDSHRTCSIYDTEKIPASTFALSFGIVILFFYEVFLSGVEGGTAQPFNLPMLCIFIGLMLFYLQDSFLLKKVFINVKKIFAITLIPSIIIVVLILLGANLPYQIIAASSGKTLTGQAYRLYMGVGVLLEQNGDLLVRLCGIYTEPGFVGTIGTLMLFGDGLKLKKWDNLLIFISMIFTFSLAFVVLIVCGWLFNQVAKIKNEKYVVTAILSLIIVVIVYFVFMSIPFVPGSELAEFQARLVIDENGLAGDNRISGYALEAYEEFLRGDFLTKLFGYGADSRKVPGMNFSIWEGVCSYKEYTFFFGFIGLFYMIGWFIFATLSKFKTVKGFNKKRIIILLIIFVISIYQRYNVTNFYSVCLLFGGCANLAIPDKVDVIKEGK